MTCVSDRRHGGRRRLGRSLAVASVLAGTALSTDGCSTGQAGSPTPAVQAGRALGPLALGVNVGAWDGTYSSTGAATINDRLRAANLRLLRYPGGSWADEYDWGTTTDTSACIGPATASGTATDPLGFDAFSAQARAAGASSFVTVNYGSASPTQAADWVAYAKSAEGRAVALWEVGSESYSCDETNDHLAQPPTSVQGYLPRGPVCPATAVMAESYAAHSLPYLKAMKRADPSARIGVPWAFTKSEAAGSAVTDAGSWNDEVLSADRTDIDFVDAHWYPFDSVSGVSDQQILDSVQRIPAVVAAMRAALERHAPDAAIVVGETNISNQATTLDFQPVAALFAAATSLEWLAQGVESVDWWDLNNFGSPDGGDYGLLSSGSPEAEPAGTPLPPYFGEVLASMLTSPGSRLTPLDAGTHTLLGFRSDLGGRRHVLLINTDPSHPVTLAPSWFSSGSTIETATYGASTAADPNPIVESTTSSDTSFSLPAQSIVVLSGAPRP
jgi:hypothetical protein